MLTRNEDLIFNQMKYDFANPMDRSADIISYAAGHKALGLYAMWALRNEIVKQLEALTRLSPIYFSPDNLKFDFLNGFN